MKKKPINKLMRITLHNFRCYPDAQYEFPDYGLVLLSGDSGVGKSSLLKAILYALYGIKAVRKPYTFGTTTCSVTLEFLGIKIQRTNRPNRVIVNEDIEDDAAQSFIDEKLGMGYDEFMVSSYIPQKNNSSILSLAQTEQLRLIKTLAFEGDQNQYKDLLKEMARESSDLLVEKRAQMDFSEREFEKIIASKPVKFPLPKKTDETIKQTIKRYQTRMNSFSSQIEKMLDERSILNEQFQNQVHTVKELELNTEKLQDLNKGLARVNVRLDQLTALLQDAPHDIEEQLNRVQKEIKYSELEKECTILQTQFDQLFTEEKLGRKKVIETLGKNLWTDGREQETQEELSSLQKTLQKWEKYLVIQKQLNSLNPKSPQEQSQEKTQRPPQEQSQVLDEIIEHYTRISEKLEISLTNTQEKLTLAVKQVEMEKNRMQCPECDALLYLRGSVLISATLNAEKFDEKQIRILKKTIADLKKKQTDNNQILQRSNVIELVKIDNVDPQTYIDMQKRITNLNGYLTKNIRKQSELLRLQRSAKLTPALLKLQKTVESKSLTLTEWKSISKIVFPILNYNVLQKRMYDLNSQKSKYKVHKIELGNIEKDKNQIVNKIKSCESAKQKLEHTLKTSFDREVIRKNLLVNKEEITVAKKRHTQDEELTDRVEEYLVYQEQEKQRKYWEQQLSDNTKEHKIAEKTHTANLILKDKYTQAEIMALESTIGSINEHTRHYLDTFFAEHQLKVVLETVYKGKKLKTFKIDTSINYKGNEYDGIGQMSGGEFDRCTLASICGINSMLGSPILILDESLSSLGTDANTEIIQFLRELAQDKLIMVCSHEAVTGIFDEIIALG